MTSEKKGQEVLLLVKIPEDKKLPEACVVPAPPVSGEQEQMITGGWRILRSVINYEECSKCLNCWIHCPEPTIKVDEEDTPHIDLKYCKGCGVCVAVCPTECIERIPELNFTEGVVRLDTPF